MSWNHIGIIAALDVEADKLKEALSDCEIRSAAGAEFYTGTIGCHKVTVVRCGIGKVSAAMCAQAMISLYEPDLIVNTGCAGGLASGIEVGDFVIAESTAEWDLDLLAIGLPRGYVDALDRVEMKTSESAGDEIAEYVPDDTRVLRGLVVSGDQFISKNEQRETIFGAFPGALCGEMEGAAIGHVCTQNGVPFCVIRCMSDTADGNSHVNYAEFSKEAGERSAQILLSFLKS